MGVFPTLAATRASFEPDSDDFLYARYTHPTGAAAESHLAALEGAAAAVLFSSGMAAITGVVQAFCRHGDHLLATAELYGGTIEMLRTVLPAWGVDMELVPVSKAATLGARVRPETRLILCESPTNPLANLVDFRALFASLGTPRPVCVLDGTFATPLGQHGLGAGFDLVLHSATKYLGGHDDLTAGVVAGREEMIAPLRDVRRRTGAMIDPHTAWLLQRGLKTLGVRWERQCANAAALARLMAEHPRVVQVNYPGLPTHPHHVLARRQMRGFGAIVAFEVQGGLSAATRVYDSLRLILRAPSLGGVETMILHPASSSHRLLSSAERQACGISEGHLRLSVGIEDADDLWEDLNTALR